MNPQLISGIDATKKPPGEGQTRGWPPLIKMDGSGEGEGGKITRLIPMKKFLLLATLMVVVNFALAQTAVVATDTNAAAARIRWWREARFGMFIHWGPVTLTGKEISWSRANSNPKCPNKGPTPVAVYDNLYKQFNPTNFNAADWAGVAKMAGMKYMVLTAKHCDGFLLWDSKVDGYNITPRRSSATSARNWHKRRAKTDCGSAGIFRRWTGATRIFARSATGLFSNGCRAKSASCLPTTAGLT